MQNTNETFYSLSIKELIEIHKWITGEFDRIFPAGSDISSHEDSMLWDSLRAKQSDISEHIIERISQIQQNTFGDVSNF